MPRRSKKQSQKLAQDLWRSRNRLEINELHRTLYAEDPDYRERHLSKMRKSYQKKKQEIRSQPKLTEHDLADLKPIITPRDLAAKFKITHSKLSRMMQEGQIPYPSEIGPDGRKGYTPVQVMRVLTWVKIARNRQEIRPKIIGRIQLSNGDLVYEPLYRLKEVSRLCLRSQQTMDRWEKEGILPTTPLRLENRRFYTEKMVESIVRYLKRYIGVNIHSRRTKHTFFKQITRLWDEHGYTGSKLLLLDPEIPIPEKIQTKEPENGQEDIGAEDQGDRAGPDQARFGSTGGEHQDGEPRYDQGP